MKLAIDAMGGDFAPQNIVAGAVAALRDNNRITKLYLVGDQSRVDAELRKLGASDNRLEIVHASEVIEMDDAPVQAVRRKKDSSLCRAIDLVKRGKADAIVSAGNTGALLTAAQLKLRTLEGIDRTGPGCNHPAPGNILVLIDAGANLEPHASNLVQYSVMGSLYSNKFSDISTARGAVFDWHRGHEGKRVDARSASNTEADGPEFCRQHRWP